MKIATYKGHLLEVAQKRQERLMETPAMFDGNTVSV